MCHYLIIDIYICIYAIFKYNDKSQIYTLHIIKKYIKKCKKKIHNIQNIVHMID